MLSRSIHDWTKRIVYDTDYPESLFPLVKQYHNTLSDMSADEVRQLILQLKGLNAISHAYLTIQLKMAIAM